MNDQIWLSWQAHDSSGHHESARGGLQVTLNLESSAKKGRRGLSGGKPASGEHRHRSGSFNAENPYGGRTAKGKA